MKWSAKGIRTVLKTANEVHSVSDCCKQLAILGMFKRESAIVLGVHVDI